jgi:hypothetical protein
MRSFARRCRATERRVLDLGGDGSLRVRSARGPRHGSAQLRAPVPHLAEPLPEAHLLAMDHRMDAVPADLDADTQQNECGQAHQFSNLRFWTRPNSSVLLVTSVSSRERACAAMKRSFAPIIVPLALSAARIWA